MLPIRVRDSLIMLAPPVVGVLVGGGWPEAHELPRLTVLVLANFFLAAHAFAFNDWAGAVLDAQDPNKSHGALLRRGITSSRILATALGLALLSLALFAALGPDLLGLGAAMIALSTLYSFPDTRFEGKRRIGLSSLLHLVGSVLYFLGGYLLVAPLDLRGVLIGLFFGLAITAGHLAQEVQDHEGDRANGIPTAAVRFGPTAAFAASTGLFTLAFLYLGWLARAGWLPSAVQGLLLLLPLQLGLAWHTARQGLTYAVVRRYRKSYQALFGLVAFALCVAIVLEGPASAGP